MFNTARRVYEARIDDLKEAHAREVGQLYKLIDVLAGEVEYLRLTAGKAQPVPRIGMEPIEAPPLMADGPAPFMSEEEEDLRAMHESELIDAAELESALAQLGITVDSD